MRNEGTYQETMLAPDFTTGTFFMLILVKSDNDVGEIGARHVYC